MNREFTEAEFEAYLEEALAPSEMAEIEMSLRDRPELVEQLSALNARRDAGLHSLGEIWRRNRVSCPKREQLGSFLLGVLPDEHAQYIQFHLEKVGCRYCRANLEDLERQQQEAADAARSRRSKYFETSAGYLHRK